MTNKPVCPTCNGVGMIGSDYMNSSDCPDCIEANPDNVNKQIAAEDKAAEQARLDIDPALAASHTGFTGTLTEFLAWLKEALSYGCVRVSTKPEDDYGSPVMRIETATGGWSEDEHLLSRVRNNPYMGIFWDSSHRGGLSVYKIPLDWFNNDQTLEWLSPETNETRLTSVSTVRIKGLPYADRVLSIAAPDLIEVVLIETDDGDEVVLRPLTQ